MIDLLGTAEQLISAARNPSLDAGLRTALALGATGLLEAHRELVELRRAQADGCAPPVATAPESRGEPTEEIAKIRVGRSFWDYQP